MWFAKVLQDPSVASSTLDQRISFLQSKNLTQEEIDLSLARAGDGASVIGANTAPSSQSPPQQQPDYGYRSQNLVGQHQPGYGYGYGYGPYQAGFWGTPPEYVFFFNRGFCWSFLIFRADQRDRPPRRDWRDWFIMATVSTGVGYGLYVFAKVFGLFALYLLEEFSN